MEVLYVWYEQTRENGVHQTGVDRPSFIGEYKLLYLIKHIELYGC